MVIVLTAIMSDNSNLPGYSYFTHEIFQHLTNQNQGDSYVMIESKLSDHFYKEKNH